MARVLVIEDEGIVRVMLRTMLQTAGYEVFEARDGEERLQVFVRKTVGFRKEHVEAFGGK